MWNYFGGRRSNYFNRVYTVMGMVLYLRDFMYSFFVIVFQKDLRKGEIH